MMHLNPHDVVSMIKQAEREHECITIRCMRKTKASKAGGPDQGDYYDLICTTKPHDYVRKTSQDRKAQDESNGVLTVYVVNRNDRETGKPGAWRTVNVSAVVKVIYKGAEYFVNTTAGYTGTSH